MDGRVDFAPSEDVGESVQLVHPDGSVVRGARAVFEVLNESPDHGWLVRAYDSVPGVAAVSEWVYAWIAAHRDFSLRVTRLSFGLRVVPATFDSVSWLFLKVLAGIYLAAFVSLGLQVGGLIGSRGILPASGYLGYLGQNLGVSRFWLAPTVFWLNSSDAALTAGWVAGIALSILLLFGIARRIVLVGLFVVYLSFSTVGQDFLSFQWDALLIETGFLAIFLGSSRWVVWLFRALLFRLMFLSGAVKLLSHDAAWRGLDALSYHYWTQPLPNPVAWFANLLPSWFQRVSTAGVLGIELVAPFLIFFPRRVRHLGAWLLIGLQLAILLTGNYAFFNLLTLGLCLFLFDDQWLLRWRLPRLQVGGRLPWLVSVFALLGLLGVVQLGSSLSLPLPEPLEALLRFASPFELVNGYGLFAVMTTSRREIVVQGSDDGVLWLDYEFRFKPGDPRRAPPFVAPYQPRLDWQMWFAALGEWRGSPWFVSFMRRLLEGSPEVLGLLGRNPFSGHAPKFVRALEYQYRFTGAGGKDWWRRELKGVYFPAVSLGAFDSK